jgi:hypothetical protein
MENVLNEQNTYIVELPATAAASGDELTYSSTAERSRFSPQTMTTEQPM